MARIRSRDTNPEMLLRRALWARGVRYRLHLPVVGIRPDLVFPEEHLAVFIDGCQWHGCPEHYVRPRTREAFWSSKLEANVARDVRQTAELEAAGWRVLRLWEHEVEEGPQEVADAVMAVLAGVDPRDLEAWRVVAVDVLDPAIDLEQRKLVELRHPHLVETVQRIRTTRKWRRKFSS